MKSQYYIFLFGAYTCSAFAQVLPPDRTNFADQASFKQPELLKKSSVKINTLSPTVSDQMGLEQLINTAITTQNWKDLEHLLNTYKNTPNYDVILYQYGFGALYRHQGKYTQAIHLYRSMLNANPDLVYPRFDLGVMLFENKQYKDAETELKQVYPQVSGNVQAIIRQVLKVIDKTQSWTPQFNLSYQRTNNVNQASDAKEIVVNDAVFIRSEDSMPQKAEGMSYQLGVSKSNNLFGNHYSYFALNFNGTSYWDNSDYSEQTLRANVGYQYKDHHKSIGVIPFIEQNILGDNRYGKNYGTNLLYSQKLTNKLQISTNTSYIQKTYRDESLARIYNGKNYGQSVFLTYQPVGNWMAYTGLDFVYDDLKDESESSKKKGIRIGFLHSNPILSFDTSLGYGKRKFEADNLWYGKVRSDDEYQFNVSVWNQQLQWKGFIPKLNYFYRKIDSNLPLYQRDNSNVYLSVFRNF
jgi:outer membrane protein